MVGPVVNSGARTLDPAEPAGALAQEAQALMDGSRQMGVLNAERLTQGLAKVAAHDPGHAAKLRTEIEPQLAGADQQRLASDFSAAMNPHAVPAQAGTTPTDTSSKPGLATVLTPDATVVGYTQRPVAAFGQVNSLVSGNFVLLGEGSTTYFHSHVVEKWPVGNGWLTGGLVGTWNDKSTEFEAGLGSGYKVNLGGVDGLLWANGRINQSALTGDGNFTVSGNVGVAVSASDLAAKGLSIVGGPAAKVAIPKAMDLVDKAFAPDVWLGAAWRAEVGFRNGQPDSVNISGQKMSVEEFGDLLVRPQEAAAARKFINNDLGNTYNSQSYPF